MKLIHPASHPFHEAEKHLRQADSRMAELIDRHGEPCALTKPPPSPFHALARTVIDQQLHVKAAQRIAARLLALQGGECFDPAALRELDETAWREAGLSGSKTRYIQGLARAVLDGKLDFDALRVLSDAEALRSLTAHSGVGQWTAEIFLMFAFGRTDILPLGDLALRNAIRQMYGLEETTPRAAYFSVAEIWRPYRSIASWYLWTAVD
jgi:DNA-3-methyladenine glycosylase II